MEVLYERCCGLDIHKKLVVACMITPGPKGAPRKEVRSFGTMTADLLVLGDWLEDQGATHVAVESRGRGLAAAFVPVASQPDRRG